MIRQNVPDSILKDLYEVKGNFELPLYYDGRLYLIQKKGDQLTSTRGVLKSTYDCFKTTEATYQLAEQCLDLARKGHAYPLNELLENLSFTKWDAKGKALVELKNKSLLEKRYVLENVVDGLKKELVRENEELKVHWQLAEIEGKLKGLKGRKTMLTKELVDKWLSTYSLVSTDSILTMAETMGVKIEKALRPETSEVPELATAELGTSEEMSTNLDEYHQTDYDVSVENLREFLRIAIDAGVLHVQRVQAPRSVKVLSGAFKLDPATTENLILTAITPILGEQKESQLKKKLISEADNTKPMKYTAVTKPVSGANEYKVVAVEDSSKNLSNATLVNVDSMGPAMALARDQAADKNRKAQEDAKEAARIAAEEAKAAANKVEEALSRLSRLDASNLLEICSLTGADVWPVIVEAKNIGLTLAPTVEGVYQALVSERCDSLKENLEEHFYFVVNKSLNEARSTVAKLLEGLDEEALARLSGIESILASRKIVG